MTSLPDGFQCLLRCLTVVDVPGVTGFGDCPTSWGSSSSTLGDLIFSGPKNPLKSPEFDGSAGLNSNFFMGKLASTLIPNDVETRLNNETLIFL